ncbi:MAG: hypothetical protein CMI16_03145 [Opitutaceae bacterium]|nr:hypothetical protein [Opitutaceae bacterium]
MRVSSAAAGEDAPLDRGAETPAPPHGNPLWVARRDAPHGAFLVVAGDDTESDDDDTAGSEGEGGSGGDRFLFRMSFSDCGVDDNSAFMSIHQPPPDSEKKPKHMWNPRLLHSPQLSPSAAPPTNQHRKLFLYWLRQKRRRDETRFDEDDDNEGLPHLPAGTVLVPHVFEKTKRIPRFPDLPKNVNTVDEPVSTLSACALLALRTSPALRLVEASDLHPVMNSYKRSTDTASMRPYASTGVCLVRYEAKDEVATSAAAEAIRSPRGDGTDTNEESDEDGDERDRVRRPGTRFERSSSSRRSTWATASLASPPPRKRKKE